MAGVGAPGSDGSPLSFPCELPIKVFGRNVQGFRQTVLAIVRSHYAGLAPEDVAEQSSREGRFLSLTITVRADSREQVDAVYQALVDSGDVLMVL